MTLAPIVLFVYNRPWHTRQTLSALMANELADSSFLTIYCDGAKDNATIEQRSKIEEVRKIVREKQWCGKVEIVESNKNIGLAGSIINGVTKIVNQYGKIIVLEDDIVTSPFFLKFMNDALNFYEDQEKIMHITGYCYPIDNTKLKETFLIQLPICWGWSTWKRSWKYFEKKPSELISRFSKKKITDFNLNNSYDFYSNIDSNINREIDTWAVFWYATIFFEKGLSLVPKESLVINIGNDASGINSTNNKNFDVKINKIEINFFEKKVEFNHYANNQIIKFLRTLNNQRRYSIIERILIKLKGLYEKTN